MIIYHVDAFTSKIFAGNPAAVCITEEPLNEELMQNIAMEMNLSETAFVVKQEDSFLLRWFTPKTEVNLCGHATLASAHVLYEIGMANINKKLEFHTKSGVLLTYKDNDGIVLDFPAKTIYEIEAPDNIEYILGTSITACSKTNTNEYLIEIDDEDKLRKITPVISAFPDIAVARGIIVTARSTKYDFVSRYFAPAVGVNEDPVTGSAHCALIPYWSKKLNKTVLKAFQASKRGGEISCELIGDRVKIGGNALTIMICDFKNL